MKCTKSAYLFFEFYASYGNVCEIFKWFLLKLTTNYMHHWAALFFFFCSAAAAHNFVQTISAQKDLSILLWLCRATDAQLALAHCICIMWMLLNNDKTLSLQPMEKMRIISVNSKWRGIVDLWWRGKILLGDCITVYAFHSTSKCCVYFFMHAFVPQDGKLCIIITNRSCRITT